MKERGTNKPRRMTHDLAFSALIACGHCGCSLVGEIKKQRYVYYHCTGYADKCQGNPTSCRRKYVREELLERQFTELLGRLRFDDEVLVWVREALRASHADQRREHREAIERLRAEYDRLERRIEAMYINKLDGKIGADFYDKNGWPMAGGAKPLYARRRAPPGGRAVIHGRGRADSRTRPERAGPLRAPARSGKAPAAQLRIIELFLGERPR